MVWRGVTWPNAKKRAADTTLRLCASACPFFALAPPGPTSKIPTRLLHENGVQCRVKSSKWGYFPVSPVGEEGRDESRPYTLASEGWRSQVGGLCRGSLLSPTSPSRARSLVRTSERCPMRATVPGWRGNSGVGSAAGAAAGVPGRNPVSSVGDLGAGGGGPMPEQERVGSGPQFGHGSARRSAGIGGCAYT